MRSPFLRILAAIIVAGSIAGGIYTTTQDGPPPPPERTAHLWVDANGGTCTRSSTPAEYADASACSSFQNAYDAASCGDLVLVVAGTYSGQLLSYSSGKADSCNGNNVEIEAEGTVTLNGNSPDNRALQFGRATSDSARDITVRGFTLAASLYFYPGARRITAEDLTAGLFFLRCAHDITLSDNLWTSPQGTSHPQISASSSTIARPSGSTDLCPADSSPSAGVLIDNSRFSQIWRPEGDTTTHMECLHIMGVDGLVVRNNVFDECLGNTAAISLNVHYGSIIEGVVIEGNSIWKTYSGGGYPQPTGEGPAFNIGGGGDCNQDVELLVRFNTIHSSDVATMQACPTGSGIVLDSNLFLRAAPTCTSRADTYVWRYNIAESGSWDASCDDGNNGVGSTSVVDRNTGDLQLSSGSFAVDEGNPSGPPSPDRFGTTRPQGSAPDTGFHEKE